MFAFDRERFFGEFAARTRLPLAPQRQEALEHLLGCLERDGAFTMIRELAYVLATIRWETGHTFLPVEERRASAARQPDLCRRQAAYWGFHGRGYVQITWDANYRRAGRELAGREYALDGETVHVGPETFVAQPDLVRVPAISYDIAASGMRKGWFTGKKLGDYIREGAAPDYVSCRRIINGLDHAQDIAAYADQFELLLRGAAGAAGAGERRGRRAPRRVQAPRAAPGRKAPAVRMVTVEVNGVKVRRAVGRPVRLGKPARSAGRKVPAKAKTPRGVRRD